MVKKAKKKKEPRLFDIEATAMVGGDYFYDSSPVSDDDDLPMSLTIKSGGKTVTVIIE